MPGKPTRPTVKPDSNHCKNKIQRSSEEAVLIHKQIAVLNCGTQDCCRQSSTNRNAVWEEDLLTCIEDPATSMESDSARRWCTKFTFSRLTVSPKNVTSGFRIPPHLLQAGTWKLRTCSSVRKTSPSGATPNASAFQVGFRASKCS